MRVPRLLLFSLLILLCVATAAAQSSPDKSYDSSQPVSALPQNAHASPDLFQIQLSFEVDGKASPSARVIEGENDSLIIRSLDSHRRHIITLQQNEATCYTLRTYRVARENPHSDSTRPAGYSTCERATRFQLRTTVDSREIVSR
jgi:hypothetical protein